VNSPKSSFPRCVEPEWLDELPPDNPEAQRCRRDLVRINWFMRNPAIIGAALAKHAPREGWSLVELGAGDGAFASETVYRLPKEQRPRKVTLVDRLPVVDRAGVERLEALGCEVNTAQADVFEWLEQTGRGHVLMANLFLHHFRDHDLARLLALIGRRADLFLACEPHRSRFAVKFAGPLLRLIGCSKVTRHDGVISVHAGFRDQELSALWEAREGWDLRERPAGWFSHFFCARRLDPGEQI
jgi:hypothetical protein